MHMKWYYHVIIILALILFTLFFYQDGFGSVSFLFASIYLAAIFLAEMNRQKKARK